MILNFIHKVYKVLNNHQKIKENRISSSYISFKIITNFLLIILLIIECKNIYFEISENGYNKLLENNKTFSINFTNYDNKSETFYLNLSYNDISFSLKYNIIEIIYNIYIFDEGKNKIKPFDLAFHYDLHIFCNIKLKNNNTEIESFPNFNNNTSLMCIENFQAYDKVDLGIKIFHKVNTEYELLSTFYYFNNLNFSFPFYSKNFDNKFSPIVINSEYINLINEINENKEKLTLKASYIKKPSLSPKSNTDEENDKWIFKNIYNNYFCYCKGINCEKNTYNFQECKYYYYLTVVDNNRNLYDKTEYLLADFINSTHNNDDILPIFKQMINQNLSAHYNTVKEDIYKEYCFDNKRCTLIIKDNFINGDFLEKYLNLILKLKVTIAGSDFPAINHLFYNIEYITSINIGHGVKFFKSFLYKDYTSPKKYNKILLAPSSKIISVAKKFGWKEENIIKICLPKWDKYNNSSKAKIDHKSIFIFFTFRENIDSKSFQGGGPIYMSQFYLNNILNLVNDRKLNMELDKNNITLYFGIHQNYYYIKDYISKEYKFVKLIKNEMVSECLMNSSLLVTDFSSVTFDFIYQKKPVIIYIPDYKDPNIKGLYWNDYYELINNLGNKTIYFENQFYTTQDVVDKIIFYINNNFKIENKIELFYDSFEFKCGNNIKQRFIDYIKNLK